MILFSDIGLRVNHGYFRVDRNGQVVRKLEIVGAMLFFNLGRRDLPWTLLVCVTCGFLAIILAADASSSENSVAQHLLSGICCVVAAIFAFVSLAKIICGKGDFCPSEPEESYEAIRDDCNNSGPASFTVKIPVSHIAHVGKVEKTQKVKSQESLPSTISKSQDDSKLQSPRTLYSQRLSPRNDRDIDCGIELAKAPEEFE